MIRFSCLAESKTPPDLQDIKSEIKWMEVPGGGVLRFAVMRGRADFQGRLFGPKYFRQGANLGFN